MCAWEALGEGRMARMAALWSKVGKHGQAGSWNPALPTCPARAPGSSCISPGEGASLSGLAAQKRHLDLLLSKVP